MPVLPPAEKLPLAVRKNLRDEYENKKADYEKELSELLGQPWTFDIDARAIWPYHNDESFSKERIGSCIQSYVEGIIWGLKNFDRTYGDEGKKEVNSIVYKHSVTLQYDDSRKYTYCGPQITDGQLVILFSEGQLGVNCSYCIEDGPLQDALNAADTPPSQAAAPPALSYAARIGIKKDYEPRIEELQRKIADQVKVPHLKLSPNFEANFTRLKAAAGPADLRPDWQKNLGSYTYMYFEGLEYWLRYHKFAEDDLLHEGFQETVDKNEVQFRVVDQLETSQSSYNECVVRDGVVYLQTTPKTWESNINDAASKILDQL